MWINTTITTTSAESLSLIVTFSLHRIRMPIWSLLGLLRLSLEWMHGRSERTQGQHQQMQSIRRCMLLPNTNELTFHFLPQEQLFCTTAFCLCIWTKLWPWSNSLQMQWVRTYPPTPAKYSEKYFLLCSTLAGLNSWPRIYLLQGVDGERRR